MTDYQGPERRRIPDDFHDQLALLLQEVTSAEVAKAVGPISDEITRLRRVIEGENGGSVFSIGVVGAIEKVIRTDEAHDARLTKLEARWDRLRWTVAGSALGGAVGGGGLVVWISKLLGGAL